jgi:hypothetical protein
MKKEESICQTKKIKVGPGTKTNWLTDRRSHCNLDFNLRDCTANYRPVLSSERREKVIVTQRIVKSGHLLQRGPDTKANWLSDRRSQYNLILNLNDFDLNDGQPVSVPWCRAPSGSHDQMFVTV